MENKKLNLSYLKDNNIDYIDQIGSSIVFLKNNEESEMESFDMKDPHDEFKIKVSNFITSTLDGIDTKTLSKNLGNINMSGCCQITIDYRDRLIWCIDDYSHLKDLHLRMHIEKEMGEIKKLKEVLNPDLEHDIRCINEIEDIVNI